MVVAEHPDPFARAGTSGNVYGPWNPGVSADLTLRLCSLCTVFRPQNVFTTLEDAIELRDATGFDLSDLVTFRPERLVLHELLIRVIADFEVPDPANAQISSLGINFRRMTQTNLGRHIEPRMQEFVSETESIRVAMARYINDELASMRSVPSGGPASGAGGPPGRDVAPSWPEGACAGSQRSCNPSGAAGVATLWPPARRQYPGWAPHATHRTRHTARYE